MNYYQIEYKTSKRPYNIMYHSYESPEVLKKDIIKNYNIESFRFKLYGEPTHSKPYPKPILGEDYSEWIEVGEKPEERIFALACYSREEDKWFNVGRGWDFEYANRTKERLLTNASKHPRPYMKVEMFEITDWDGHQFEEYWNENYSQELKHEVVEGVCNNPKCENMHNGKFNLVEGKYECMSCMQWGTYEELPLTTNNEPKRNHKLKIIKHLNLMSEWIMNQYSSMEWVRRNKKEVSFLCIYCRKDKDGSFHSSNIKRIKGSKSILVGKILKEEPWEEIITPEERIDKLEIESTELNQAYPYVEFVDFKTFNEIVFDNQVEYNEDAESYSCIIKKENNEIIKYITRKKVNNDSGSYNI